MTSQNGSNSNMIWIGIGVGAAIGLAFALSRRKKDRWSAAKEVSQRFADRSGDLAAAGKDIVDRIKVIYDESRKVVEEAGELWSHGRKLVGV
jgi:LPXTG-motif cell wall-anchored protein